MVVICDFCKHYIEQYFYGSTARYCTLYDKWCTEVERDDKKRIRFLSSDVDKSIRCDGFSVTEDIY